MSKVKTLGFILSAVLLALAGDIFIMGSAHAETVTRYTHQVCQRQVKGDTVITNCTETVRDVPVSLKSAEGYAEKFGTSASVGQVQKAMSGLSEGIETSHSHTDAK